MNQINYYRVIFVVLTAMLIVETFYPLGPIVSEIIGEELMRFTGTGLAILLIYSGYMSFRKSIWKWMDAQSQL